MPNLNEEWWANMVTGLQQICSASTANVDSQIYPHHPIQCTGDLYYFEDGSMACDHAKTDAKDSRTRACLIHSVAILLIEMAETATAIQVRPWWTNETEPSVESVNERSF